MREPTIALTLHLPAEEFAAIDAAATLAQMPRASWAKHALRAAAKPAGEPSLVGPRLIQQLEAALRAQMQTLKLTTTVEVSRAETKATEINSYLDSLGA